MNTIYINGEILDSQKRELYYIPKTIPNRTSDFRPLTLLNADFKLQSRLTANRMKRYINNVMHPNQYCGAHDNNVYGAITAIRETIANSELTNTLACILTLGFKDAFDNIAHTSIFNHGSIWVQYNIPRQDTENVHKLNLLGTN
jgi:hypothetical protein